MVKATVIFTLLYWNFAEAKKRTAGSLTNHNDADASVTSHQNVPDSALFRIDKVSVVCSLPLRTCSQMTAQSVPDGGCTQWRLIFSFMNLTTVTWGCRRLHWSSLDNSAQLDLLGEFILPHARCVEETFAGKKMYFWVVYSCFAYFPACKNLSISQCNHPVWDWPYWTAHLQRFHVESSLSPPALPPENCSSMDSWWSFTDLTTSLWNNNSINTATMTKGKTISQPAS